MSIMNDGRRSSPRHPHPPSLPQESVDDVVFASTSNSRRIDQNQKQQQQLQHPELHANSFVGDVDDAPMSSSTETPGEDGGGGGEASGRTVEYLERVGFRITDERTAAQKIKDKAKHTCDNVRCRDVAQTFFPPLRWLPSYEWKTDLPKDIMGGITICVLLIPQGIAYGQLASIPPIYGLYTAFFAPILYCLFGTCRQLSFGTMAVVTIMTGAIVERVSAIHYSPSNATTTTTTTTTTTSSFTLGEDPNLVTLKVSVLASASLLMGLIQLLLGFLRFGYIASLMSEPLTRAFTTGCACFVFGSELKHFFGLEDPNGVRPDREKGIFGLPWTFYDVFLRITELKWGNFIIGVSTAVLLILFKSVISPTIKKRLWTSMPMEIPIDIIVVIIATLLSWAFNFQQKFDVAVVGEIPAGFPTPSIPEPRFFVDMIPDCFVLALVGFAISISLSKIVAKRNEYVIEPNVDLVAYGASNTIGSLFSCMPCSGCISRTLLLDSLGVKSQIQGLVSSCVMLLVLMVLGQYFKWLPNSVLAAIIMVAIRKMFLQVTDIPKLWRISKPDCLIWILTFLSTILIDVPYGLLVGIPFSLLVVVVRAVAPPHVALLGRLNGTKTNGTSSPSSSSSIYDDVRLYGNLGEISGVKIVRLESSIFFGNAEATRDALVAQVGIDFVKARKKWRKSQEEAATAAAAADGPAAGAAADAATSRESNGARRRVGAKEGVVEENRRNGLSTNRGAFEADTAAILSREDDDEEEGVEGDVGCVVVDCSAVAFTDYVGVMTLGQIVKEYQSIGIATLLVGCRPSVISIIRRTEEAGIPDAVLFLTIDDALLKCQRRY